MMDGDGETAPAEGLRSRENFMRSVRPEQARYWDAVAQFQN